MKEIDGNIQNDPNKWDYAFMDMAVRFSQLSTARRLKVGCLIVKHGRVISIGYNGTPSGWDNDCESLIDDEIVTNPWVLHAEENALGKMAASQESSEGATMYLTHAPCLQCAKQIQAAKIGLVWYKDIYRSSNGLDFLMMCNIEVRQIK